MGNRQYAFHYFRNYDWQNADWFCKMTHGSWASLAELHDGKEVEGVMNFVKTVGARQRSSARAHAYALTAKSPCQLHFLEGCWYVSYMVSWQSMAASPHRQRIAATSCVTPCMSRAGGSVSAGGPEAGLK